MRKIAIGNSINIKMNNCIIDIEEIYINNIINSNFNINIIRDGKTIHSIEFPLVNQTLLKGDYLYSSGIYRASSGTTKQYTEEQLIAFQSMSNINISKGDFYVAASNVNINIKLYYYEKEQKDSQIYVLNKNEELITVFNVDDKNPIFNPRVRKVQNAESVFTFSISPNNPKWQEINNPENLYVVDNKVYSTNFEGCFQEMISDTNEDYVLVTAYERQKLLSRRYVRAWNSKTGFDAIDTFMVVILSFIRNIRICTRCVIIRNWLESRNL